MKSIKLCFFFAFISTYTYIFSQEVFMERTFNQTIFTHYQDAAYAGNGEWIVAVDEILPYSGFYGSRHAHLYKIDEQGNTIWAKNINPFWEEGLRSEITENRKITILPDGRIVALLHAQLGTDFGFEGFFRVEYAADGTLIEEMFLPDGYGAPGIASIIFNEEGTLFTASFPSKINKLSSTGELSTIADLGDDVFIYDLLATDNNQILISSSEGFTFITEGGEIVADFATLIAIQQTQQIGDDTYAFISGPAWGIFDGSTGIVSDLESIDGFGSLNSFVALEGDIPAIWVQGIDLATGLGKIEKLPHPDGSYTILFSDPALAPKNLCLSEDRLLIGGNEFHGTEVHHAFAKTYDILNGTAEDHPVDIGVVDIQIENGMIDILDPIEPIPFYTFDARITVTNFGDIPISALHISTLLDTGSLPPYGTTYYLALDDLDIAPGESEEFVIENMTQYYASEGNDLSFCVWTSGPNHRIDKDHTNDEFCANFIVTSIAAQNALNAFKAFPNPVQNTLSIELPSTIAQQPFEKNIVLFNLQGKKVHQTVLQTNQYNLDLQNLPSGIYFLQMNIGDEIWTEKIVKE